MKKGVKALTSNSSNVSIWVWRTGMPFNSFSVVMVLITPSALWDTTPERGLTVRTLLTRGYDRTSQIMTNH